VWTLELLLLLRRDPQSEWTCEALVRELRGSLGLVVQNLGVLMKAGLVAEVGDGRYVYRPETPELAAHANGLAEVYARKPVAVLRVILTMPNDKIRSFADAFVFKKRQEKP
jgi:hypothetical protein